MPIQKNSKSGVAWISRDAVFQALDMNDVLTHYDIQSGDGTSFRIHCPFHEDERPSCSINTDAKVFNCFSCGEQGNVLDFIAGMEDLDASSDFRAVLEKAIEIIGHNPSANGGKSEGNKRGGKCSKRAKVKAEPASDDDGQPQEKIATKPHGKNRQKVRAKARSEAKAFKERDVDASLELEPNRVLEGPAFPLKLDHEHPWLKQRLQAIGLTLQDAERLGIGYETRSNALMAGRICFPIHNDEGGLVAYAGRWASDERDARGLFLDKNGREQERYKLPSGFKKQLELYNLDEVVGSFPDNEHLIIVEGVWSALRLSSLNIPVVALMGLSISQAQIDLLKRYCVNHLTLMLDGDDEGKMASQKLLEKLSPHFFVRNANLTDGIKPDEVDEQFLKQFGIITEIAPEVDIGASDNSDDCDGTNVSIGRGGNDRNQKTTGPLSLAGIGSTSLSFLLPNECDRTDW